MLMPKISQRVDPALRAHLWLIAGLAAATLVLLFRPDWIVDAGYRCQMQMLFGLRCPFCGMTRDFVAILHGARPALNPSSWLAAAVVYGVYPITVAMAWRAGRLDIFRSAGLKSAVVAALVVMTVLNNLR